MKLPDDFLALSQKIGSNPLLVQGPGGNTSFKHNDQMWIKASGTELANALTQDIFVAVDPRKAILELDGAGDGSCRSALIDPNGKLRPSIETTFHAMFNAKFVFHYHSVNTICHAIAVEGRQFLDEKLAGLRWVSTPYRKPGIPLSKAIRDAVGNQDVQVIILNNHGVIILGETVQQIDELINEVEQRLKMPVLAPSHPSAQQQPFAGWERIDEVAALVMDSTTLSRATSGTYYPDHVVFLGPALPVVDQDDIKQINTSDFPVPVVLVRNHGAYLKTDSTASQRSMLHCVHDVLVRTPSQWQLEPIGTEAETELLNWDAEKYRQMLAKQ